MMTPATCDVLVVGSGNAGFSAALSAKLSGAKNVILIDKCPEKWAGGNSYFTAGAYRVAHDGLKDILPQVDNVSEEQAAKIELAPYTEADFLSDIRRVCEDKSDPALSHILVSESNAAVKWLAANGIRYSLSFDRQAYEVDGKLKFWGGLCLRTLDGGKSLIQDYRDAAQKHAIEVHFSTELVSLHHAVDGKHVVAQVKCDGGLSEITAGAVILAAGGFEANPEMRSRFLGRGWDKAAVRGTPYNTGDCLLLAQEALGAQPVGDWAGCHSVAWDARADPSQGDRLASNEHTKSGYPLGLMLNINGKRFVDEGEDLRNYTYAKFGRAILQQPEHTAFQIWDSQTSGWLRSEEYRKERAERLEADTIEDLADLCANRGLTDKDAFLRTIKQYNNAIHARDAEAAPAWDPAVKDGLSTGAALALPKSNWALPIDKPPFLAVKVTCGITFTFGGLRVDPETAKLVDGAGELIPGVYCVGEMLGGLFHGNYPGGSGLTSEHQKENEDEFMHLPAGGPYSYTEPYLAFATSLAALPDEDLPSVVSISYGVNEQLLSRDYAQHVCDVFGQLSARGVSVLAASGDAGPGQSCQSNTCGKATRFLPAFPASCPYVTAVGATRDLLSETAMELSGGGFSEYFPRPAYQNGAVDAYLLRHGRQWKGLYNEKGRGIPDVAALGRNYQLYYHCAVDSADGTSASTPVLASMIAVLNGLRAQKGRPPMGFLNTWLYTIGRFGFTDITTGKSSGCPGTSYSGQVSPKVDGAGWDADWGWDAATGWGTPVFSRLRRLACL
ncbi:hypothetical protein NLG97_g2683 [Lecanicillium saksenae]|uniref:Uncharacterized protein n=1 Tax=Lecanicillium saksenae TaxID=468837 RepID=A0ACC1R1G5_9HYPO|nr:hypothetical protein NLG97_g2683 [Lecanicillium saksenae]